MEITLLIKSGMGLIAILSILIFILLSSQKKKAIKKRASTKTKPTQKENITLDYLRAKIRERKTDAKELKVLLDLVIKHHGTIHKKLGLRPHPDFDAYMEIIITICRHPNTNKHLIVQFDRELSKLNPEYLHEINDALAKGLNSRGL